MNEARVQQLAEDVRQHAFNLLDAEPELTGDDAGRVAASVEQAFLSAMIELLA